MPDDVEARLDRLEELMRDTQELVEENNRVLRTMLRGNRLAFWGKVLFWIVIIVLPLIFLKPILNTILPITGISTGSTSGVGISSFPSTAEIQTLLQEYKSQTQK